MGSFVSRDEPQVQPPLPQSATLETLGFLSMPLTRLPVESRSLELGRLARLQQALAATDHAGAVFFNPINIRYATGTPNMQVYGLHSACHPGAGSGRGRNGGAKAIARQEKEAVTLGVALGTATKAIQRAMHELQLPPGLTTTFQGNAQAFQDSLTSVPLLILAALVCVYLILGVLYESFIHPLTILSTLRSAGLGALVTLMLFGYEFSLVALIGTILLIGIVKKICRHARGGADCGRGDPQGGAAAFPSDHDDDDGGPARRRDAYAKSRQRVSQALTLFTTPVIYLYLDRMSRWTSGSRKHEPPAPRKPKGSWEPAQAAE
jgi:hypothetical protein